MLLEVAAAAVIVDGRLLTVSGTAAPAVFYLPGGGSVARWRAPDVLARLLVARLLGEGLLA